MLLPTSAHFRLKSTFFQDSLRKRDTRSSPIEAEFEALQAIERLSYVGLRWSGTIDQQETATSRAR
jgi:hypothetical protein